MSRSYTTRAFAYNPGAPLPGTEQYGNLAVQTADERYDENYGGLQWWSGPEEDTGYVVAYAQTNGLHPTPVPEQTASVGFFRTANLSDPEFISLAEYILNSNFATAQNAFDALTNSGFWTSWNGGV
jgi:hypothetical protein